MYALLPDLLLTNSTTAMHFNHYLLKKRKPPFDKLIAYLKRKKKVKT